MILFDVNGKLVIFEDFRVDRNLPKFQMKESENENDSEDFGVLRSVSSGRSRLVLNSVGRMNVSRLVESGESVGYNRRSLWRRFLDLFRRRPLTMEEHIEAMRPPEPKNAISIEDFFKSMKNSTEELQVVEQRARGYELQLQRAKDAGQVALFEQLEKLLVAVRAETQLVAIGFPKYLPEEKVVEFVKKAKRGIRIDWMANFTRIVPDDVLAKKKRCDELGLFDNYVVMHYDPEGKSWAQTQAEKERRKDPILFGLIEGRRNLYYVGDWVDELCDLTLDQIADVTGSVPEISKEYT